MTRETSTETFRQITEEGLLTKLRQQVYEIIVKHGPMTAHELVAKGQEIFNTTNPMDSWHQRLSEMERSSVIRTNGKRPCKITGRLVYEWESTNNLPIKTESKKKAKRPKKLDQHILFHHGLTVREYRRKTGGKTR